jgi:Leucine-rich repeat (LRR) protein
MLDLQNTRVTDVGLAHLRGLVNLQSLDLGNTRITDKGLQMLRGLTNLRRLGLSNTKTTNQGMQDLQRAVPTVKGSARPLELWERQ